MRHTTTLLGLVLAFAAAAASAQGERNPARGMRPVVEPADSARVIVKFKASSDLARKHALSATAGAAEANEKLAARATALGTRIGLSLATGRALDERTQVLTASGVSGPVLARRLAQEADVEYAVVDHRRRALKVPNDPLYAQGPAIVGSTGGPAVGQWYLKAPTSTVLASINAAGAWDLNTGSDSIVVAVLDTGVRSDHPDLAGKLLAGYDMIHDAAVANDGSGRDSDPSDPGDWVSQADIDGGSLASIGCTKDDITDSSWHGTLTGSLIGAASNNGVGMAGVSWGSKLLPVRVLGKCGGYDSDIIAGMKWAAGFAVPGLPTNTTPARVLNLSLGGEGACESGYVDAMTQLTAAKVVVVASAGNSEGLAVGTPANCAGVIAVAGLRHIGTKVGFSSLGPEVTISSPGGNCVNSSGACLYPILAATNSGTQGPAASIYSDGFNVSVGTSFSAPLVSGTVALMLSQQPSLTPAAVIAALKSSARAFPTTGADAGVTQCRAPDSTKQDECYCTTTTCGAGMLDAAAAVAAVSTVTAHIDATPAAPTAGQTVTLSAAASTLASGRSIASVQWTLVDGGTTGAAFVGATTGTTATLQTSAAGSFAVRASVTDDQGASGSTALTVSVAAAPVPTPTPTPTSTATSSGGGGGGGGAISPLALLALAAAAVALGVRRGNS
ncbi:MAG TPA: S8 family peptidase [Burkholderiaceae bacterium]|jgi:serine protease|nr:S8 family peptidase [Burkholderiaceae bacterium]